MILEIVFFQGLGWLKMVMLSHVLGGDMAHKIVFQLGSLACN